MSGYGKQIAYLAAIGVVISLGIGLGIYYSNPSGILDSTTNSTTTHSPGNVGTQECVNVSGNIFVKVPCPQSTSSSSESTCVPSSGYISTTTLVKSSGTTTLQEVFDGTPCDFGNNYFEPPSAILIPANTIIWTDFQLQENGSYVGSSFQFLSYPRTLGANLTVAVYSNSNLVGSSSTLITQLPNEVTNSSLLPPSSSTVNSIFSLNGVTATGTASIQIGSRQNLTSSTISIAIMSNESIWLCGWTSQDMSMGSGPQFGQSIGQLSGTHEWPVSGLTLPSSLPQPTTTLTFELQVLGDYLA